MTARITAYEFAETAFVVGSDPIVCLVRKSELRGVMSLGEISQAFGGYASYRQRPWMKRYVGVWGRKNCQRLRRFLRERGAEIVLLRERPPRLALTSYLTRSVRPKVRSLFSRAG
ncbi:MAG: hypothetical protein ACJ8EB_00175 [Allosphingosinicella sp.]